MSTPLKRGPKSKFLAEDLDVFMAEPKYSKEPKGKKAQKRQQLIPHTIEEEEISEAVGHFQPMAKKSRIDVEADTGNLVREKILDIMDNQISTRKHSNDQLLKNLSQVMTQIKSDNDVLKSNHQKLQHLSSALIKCMEQATTAQEHKLKALNEIYASFKKQVEGLIMHGGMRVDDRPVWFDVYKRFPPITDPKFSRPPPEIKPIKQILYKEDAVRAKFHSQGYGLGAVNMLNAGPTTTKKLVSEYEKLKEQGVPESELVEKAAKTIDTERRERIEAQKQTASTTPTNPKSVSAQVMNEADLKNIFKE